jgi:hypothetical protein
VLSRLGSPSKLPAGVPILKVDYDSVASLTAAFQGVDVVVSGVGALAIPAQINIINGAVAAGVKRYLPSEYGHDTTDPAVQALPAYKAKADVYAYLKKVSLNSNLTYTLVATGPFLDYALKIPFLIGASKEHKAEIYDDGDKRFSTTSRSTIGKAVVGVIHHLEQTKNRVVYIQDTAITQNELLRIAQDLTPGVEWTVTHTSTAELKADSDAKIAQGIFNRDVARGYVKYSLFHKDFTSACWGKLDNELLGIKPMSNEELRELVKSVV